MKTWPVVPLIEAADISSGITLGRKAKDTDLVSVPYLRVANVQDGFLNLNEVKHVEATRSEIEKWCLKSGDLLLTEGGDLDKVGRGTCWREELPLCIHQNHIFRVRLHEEKYDPCFVSYQIGSEYGKSYFLKHAKKTTGIASINQTVLSAFPVISPPLLYQRSIAARLNEELAFVEEARNALRLQLDEIVNLAHAIIRQSIEDPATAPATLGDILDEIKQGIGKTWANYPVLGATRAGLALAKEPVGKNPERYKPVECGTVFYNPMRIMIGSIAMVDEDDAPGITSPDYVALRGRPGMVDSRWFYYWLRSPYGVRCIASLARGAVRERMLFNRLAEGDIELPRYDVQVAASKALKELKPMRAAIEMKLNKINLMPAKILARAFEV